MTITYDLNAEAFPPYPGSYLFAMSRRTSRPTGTIYLVEAVRKVARRGSAAEPLARYRLTVTRIDGTPAGSGGFPLWWHPRRRR